MWKVDALHRLLDQLAVGDRAFDELAIKPVEVVAVSGAEVVQHADGGGFSLEMLDDVGANEAGSASD